MTLNPSATLHSLRETRELGRPQAARASRFFPAGNAVADRVKLFFSIPFLSFLICAAMLCPVQALQVAPARTEIQLSPGKDVKSLITVSNDYKDPTNVTVSSKDWFVLDANKDLHVDQWLHIKGKETFRLKPGESRQITIVANCPNKAQGELVGMVSFAYVTDQPSMITPVISVSVYVAVVGTEVKAGSIKEVGVGKWKGKLHLAALVSNTGNVHLRPSGKITILNDAQQPVVSYPITEGDPTYPGKDRGYFCAQPDLQLPAGKYLAQAELTDQALVMKGEQKFSVAADGSIQMAKAETASKT